MGATVRVNFRRRPYLHQAQWRQLVISGTTLEKRGTRYPQLAAAVANSSGDVVKASVSMDGPEDITADLTSPSTATESLGASPAPPTSPLSNLGALQSSLPEVADAASSIPECD
jgi:hypothetical protein